MKRSIQWLCLVVILGLPMTAQAEEAKKSAGEGVSVTGIEKIQKMLEYHQKMVGMIQSYMKDRAQIPADYRAVSDNEFLKKARSEKMAMSKKEAPAASSKPAAEKPAKNSMPARY